MQEQVHSAAKASGTARPRAPAAGAAKHLPLLESDLVRTFVAIAETESFTRAAKRVHRTPSAVSMQVKRLEDMLGTELFVREARNVSLTPAGETLLGYSRRLLRISEEAVAQFLAAPIEGSVSFGSPDDFGTRFLPGILKRFAATHPQVEVNVVVGSSSDLIARLDAGTLDLTLITTGGCAGTTRGRTVMHEPLVWAGLKGGCAHECEPLPLALAHQGCCWRANALKALDEAGRRYRVAYTSEHWAGQQAALLADLAIAPLPASLIGPQLQRLDAIAALPELGSYAINIVRGGRKSDAIDVLEQHVVDSFADLGEPASVPAPTRPAPPERRR